MKKENYSEDKAVSVSGDKRSDRKKVAMILTTVALTVVVAAFYYFSLAFDFFPIVMWGYMIALTVLVLVYLFYNRGFSRKGITVDMLPEEWEDSKKQEFVEDAKRRLKGSKWMLVLILAFVFTFLIEALMLFVSPVFGKMFGW